MNKQSIVSSFTLTQSYEWLDPQLRKFERILFLTCPTGAYCREDRCQSFFERSLIPSMRPPLEECEAGGAISSAGASFLVIDSPALRIDEKEVKERVLRFNPDLIILSVTFGSLEEDLLWAKQCKEIMPQVPIGLRGAPCYVDPKNLLQKNQSVDFCVRGDYELVFRLLLESGLEGTLGIVFKNSRGEIIDGGVALADTLDELPLPDRTGINPNLYKVRGLGKAQATIRVQRGCPFPCTYCLVHTVSGNRARHRGANSIVKEMKSLISEGYRFFYLRAETFTLDREWALAVVKEIAKQCPSALWVTTTRVECLDDELLKEMKRAGCYGISLGLDVASKEVSKQVRKPLRKAEAVEVIRLCRKHGIISLAYIMIGFIWDTQKTLQEAREFVKEISPDLLTIHYAHPYPGTVYYEQVRESRNLDKIVSLRAQAEPAIGMEQLSASEIEEFGRSLLREHRRRPRVLLSLGWKLLRLYLMSSQIRRRSL